MPKPTPSKKDASTPGSKSNGIASAPPKKVKPPMRNMFGSLVHIKVGSKLEDFGVHKELICSASPYFRAAFTSGFEEALSGVMKLPNTKVEAFKLFMEWLYSGKIYNRIDDIRGASCDIVRLYVFADMTQITRLKNDACDALYELSEVEHLIPFGMFGYIWENTTDDSKLRRYMLDVCVHEVDPAEFSDWAEVYTEEQLPRGICIQIISWMAKALDNEANAGKADNPRLKRSNYHEVEDSKDQAGRDK